MLENMGYFHPGIVAYCARAPSPVQMQSVGGQERGVSSARGGSWSWEIDSQRDLESVLYSVSDLLCDPVWSVVLSPSPLKVSLSLLFCKDEG